MNIKIKPVHSNFKNPIKGSKGAACYDVYAADIKQLDYDLYEVNLGFATEFDNNIKGRITPRSGITKTSLIMQNSPATIDADYRGPWKIKFRVLPKKGVHYEAGKPSPIYEFPYEIGDRVAQIYFEEVNKVTFNLVDKLSDSERGEGGFNSTGLK